MARKALVVGIPNLCRTSNTSVLRESSLDTHPASNLLNDQPSSFWRCPTLDPVETYLHFRNVATEDIDVVAMVASNATPGSKYRFLLSDDSAASTSVINVAPDGAAGVSNFGGAYTDVDDDPFSPDGSSMAQTSAASDAVARFTFAAPGSGTPTTGANLQAFYIRATGGTQAQTIQAELYESAGLLLDLGTQTLSVSAAKVFGFYWNASLLATGSGVNVEVKITISSTVGTAGSLNALKWAMDRTGLASSPIDTGYLTVPAWTTDPSSGVDISTVDLGQGPQRILRNVWASGNAGKLDIRIFLRDLYNADGFLQAGVLVAGRAFEAAVHPVKAAGANLVQIIDQSSKRRTAGGQIVGTEGPNWREWFMEYPALTKAELYSILDRIDQRRGKLAPFLVILNPDSTDAYEQAYTDGYACAKELTWVRTIVAGGARYVKGYPLEEVL